MTIPLFVSNLTLDASFVDCGPIDEELVQLRVSSVGIVESFRHTAAGTPQAQIGTRRLDIKNTNTVRRLEPWAFKEAGISIAEGGFLRPVGLVVRRPMQRAMKSEDHS